MPFNATYATDSPPPPLPPHSHRQCGPRANQLYLHLLGASHSMLCTTIYNLPCCTSTRTSISLRRYLLKLFQTVCFPFCYLLSHTDVAALDLQGPVFSHEPPHKIEFSNNTGGHIECSGHGSPQPEVSRRCCADTEDI